MTRYLAAVAAGLCAAASVAVLSWSAGPAAIWPWAAGTGVAVAGICLLVGRGRAS